MKKITVKIDRESSKVTIDLGGDLDNGCCGGEASRLNKALADLGVSLELDNVHCRLPVLQRIKAKASEECNTLPERFANG